MHYKAKHLETATHASISNCSRNGTDVNYTALLLPVLLHLCSARSDFRIVNIVVFSGTSTEVLPDYI